MCFNRPILPRFLKLCLKNFLEEFLHFLEIFPVIFKSKNLEFPKKNFSTRFLEKVEINGGKYGIIVYNRKNIV